MKSVTINGVTYRSLAEACRRYNLNYERVRHQLYYGKYTINDVFNVRNSAEYITQQIIVFNTEFHSMNKLRQYYKITTTNIYTYLGSMNELIEEYLIKYSLHRKLRSVKFLYLDDIKLYLYHKYEGVNELVPTRYSINIDIPHFKFSTEVDYIEFVGDNFFSTINKLINEIIVAYSNRDKRR